ncbi:MAG: hypothetical protein QOE88_1284, partial [Verrucomicrobiota bacterium]|nr:hypothetical protein [Verrucomicrobiota bacterium]
FTALWPRPPVCDPDLKIENEDDHDEGQVSFFPESFLALDSRD